MESDTMQEHMYAIDESCHHIVVRTLWCGAKVTVCEPNAPESCKQAQQFGHCKKVTQ